MVKEGQARKLWRDLDCGWKLAVSARRAGMDEKTARKYRDSRRSPSALRLARCKVGLERGKPSWTE